LIERETEIVNRLGLHARAAAKLVHTAGAFQSRVMISKDGEDVDAKSILGVLLLAAGQGTKVTIRCDGQDEEAALRAVADLIANRFDEES
jgi:phosphocarrier protein HPr